MSIATLQPIVEALNKILVGNGLTVDTIKGIFKYIKEVEAAERNNKDRMEMQAEVSSFCKAFKDSIQQVQSNISLQLNNIVGILNVTLETSKKTLKVAEEIQGKTADIISGVGKVMNATDKIADTTLSYCNILMTRQAPTNKLNADPKVLSDMEQRDRQILVDIFDEEGTCTMDKSLMKLIDMVNKALDKTSDGQKPDRVKVKGVHKTKRNVILLTLNSKEAANWVREVGNEETFANAFSKGVHIWDREYNLIVPRVPLTFNPKKEADLREIEEVNGLPTYVILKVKWIKPAECRRPGQTYAFTVLMVMSIDTANRLIRDGLGICGSHSRLTKQKQEPIQCMKCRRWGHFADKCPESEDTYGIYGDKYCTSACNSSNKLFCILCLDSLHTSWDRSCSEFIRWCKNISKCNLVTTCNSSQQSRTGPLHPGLAGSC
jgi:hypothetical protein